MRLILASGSPRRRELLASAGVDFDVVPADVDERLQPGERPDDYVSRVAAAKAAAIPLDEHTVILAADTAVVVDEMILGKPSDEACAMGMLALLSGRWHQVLTAVVVRWSEGGGERMRHRVVKTDVEMCELSDQAIAEYVATGEPMDKAGAYGIQGAAQAFVTDVRGSRSNVAGLPIAETLDLLRSTPP